MGDEEDLVFSHSCFTFVKNADLTENLITELTDTIVKYGGQVVQPKRDGSLPLLQLTHIISETIDFPQYQEATAILLPVIRPKWIQASLLKGKQAQIRPYTPDPRMIFSNVVLSFADVPSIDKDTIIGAVMAMGGMDSENVTRQTTHICALSLDHPKCQIAITKKLKCQIVLPHWFDDCFKLGKRIDETPYVLPAAEILQVNPDDPINVPSSEHLQGATSARPDYMPESADLGTSARPKLTVFADKRIMLSSDLSIRNRLRDILQDLIQYGGGQVTDEVEDCDWFVCQYRDGPQYVRASHLNKDVGSLSWLYHIITNNEWTSPLRRLLHYPIPRDGIPEFKDKRITVSNYGGEARIYLENLITAAGATFTKTMKADNTHLITARDNSDKCAAARDWNIDMVNHLWIEESYAKCQMQSLTITKYNHFPPRTNLGEVIGQTYFDESRLQSIYYPGSPEPSTCSGARKRKALELTDKNSQSEGPAKGVVIGKQARNSHQVPESEGENDAKEDAIDLPPPKRRASEMATPAKGRRGRSDKENETPSTIASSGSRSSKLKAANAISGLAPDIALYEKEKRTSKVAAGPWGGRRATTLEEKQNQQKRRSLSDAGVDDDDDTRSEKRPAKKSRPSLPDVKMRVVLTGFKRWVNNIHRENADQKKLREMGIHVVKDGQPCDYLVAPQVVKTVKFLRNLSKGATIVSSSWIEECLDKKKFVDPEDFVLEDKENEKKFGFKLQASIDRARKNNGRLLAGTLVYCTTNIKNGMESYKAIAEVNGAHFQGYGPRSGVTIKPTNPDEDEYGPEPVYLLSNSTPEEKKLWPKFEDMARKGNMEPRVVATDWLLDVVVKQELSFDDKYHVSKFFS